MDAGGAGDFTTVGAAVTGGAQSIFIRNATYTEGPISLGDGAFLLGETAGGVILDFNGAGDNLTVDGNGGTKETGGTISVTNASTTVTGSGTMFTNLSAGDYILIGCTFYEIDSVTNDTTLDLVEAYQGNSALGLVYQAHTMFSSIQLENLIVQNSTATQGLFVRACRRSELKAVTVRNCNVGIRLEDCTETMLLNSIMEHNAGNGLEMEACHSIDITKLLSRNNDGHGASVGFQGAQGAVAGETSCINVTSSQFHSNSGSGVKTEAFSTLVTVSNNSSAHNNGSGIEIEGDGGVYSSNQARYNNLNGLELGSTADNNIVTGNLLTNNDGTNLLNSGMSNTVVSNRSS